MQINYDSQLKLFSSHKSYKNQKKAGTSFVFLSQSGNMTGWFMKTYLHQPIKILQFLRGCKIQKC